MNITFAPRGILQIDGARITHKNFSGAPSQFNRKGDKNFSLIIDDEILADKLVNDKNEYGVGWNVKVKPPRDADEDPFIYLGVKVRFNDFGPNVYLKSGNNMVRLDEESISCLDSIAIESVDLDIRPYDSEVNGKPYRSAYLQGMCVTQRKSDRFADRFESHVSEDDCPF
jgi:hypothetical protein